MSLVGRVGRKRWRARFAMGVVYGLLILGAITTLYPFLLMVSSSVTGPTDQNLNKLVPGFFRDLGLAETDWTKPQPHLFGKYLDDKYSSDLSRIQSTRIGAKASEEDVKAYEKLLAEAPVGLWEAGFRQASGQVTSKLTLRYQAWLKNRYKTVQDVNRAYLEENVAFTTVVPPSELLSRKNWRSPGDRKYREYQEFKATLPAEFRVPVRIEAMWQEFLRSRSEGRLESVPAELRVGVQRYEDLRWPGSHPLVEEFVQKAVPPQFLQDSIELRWAGLRPPTGPEANPQEGAPARRAALPAALGRTDSATRLAAINPNLPVDAYERTHVATNAQSVKSEFATRNYRYVFDYLALNGRAVLNTAIFCLMVIAAQLLVNPLAAYALSRYPIKATGKILIFLLATMAFPAEVAMIPSFLLLKDLGLLNTFWALVLPGAASGYMIYLLKGFFDSLPQELYESGAIDGAKEITMMWKIALPLSRPVLGYLALLAFMGAYGAFIFAFLIVQDRNMWTLMVSIYQLQMVAPKAVIMAALTVAAAPTLLVFLLTQRVIMRGIVLPGER